MTEPNSKMGSKISIITITLNSECYLEQTISSVVNQTYKNIEYIVVDGGSTDGTLDIIKKYESKIDHWISEKDDGIADAMNKGLGLATGDYILFLHSDDYLLRSTVLEQVATYLNIKFDVYMFQVLLDYQGRKSVSKNRSFGWHTNFKMGSCHQGQLCSRELFKQIGTFDTNFKINMDYDFLLRSYRKGYNSQAINTPISVMRLIGVSSQQHWPGLKARLLEERMVHNKNCSSHWMKFCYILYWNFYLPYRKVFLPGKSFLSFK